MKVFEWTEKNGEHHTIRIKQPPTKKIIAEAKTYKYTTLKTMLDQKREDIQAKLNDAKNEKEINTIKVKAYTAQLERLEKYSPIVLAQTKGAPVAILQADK